jgi:hypothetical protein
MRLAERRQEGGGIGPTVRIVRTGCAHGLRARRALLEFYRLSGFLARVIIIEEF